MALRFFYRRQKLVFIVMVILMVSFLVGFQGFKIACEAGRGGLTRGHTRWGKIRDRDFRSAGGELAILRALALLRGPLAPGRQKIIYILSGPQLGVAGVDRADDMALAYALLTREAEEAGVRVTDGEVENFLAGWGYGGEGRKKLIL
ncbi:MAG: hypothetical protein ACYTF6_12775, partial [Planctomycetota bacterium]